MTRSRTLIAALAVVLVSTGSGHAYDFFSGAPRWPAGAIVMQMQLGSSGGALMDGTSSWGATAEAALANWNTYLGSVEFRVVRDSTVPQGDADGRNNVFFSRTVYGRSFGDAVAVTTIWTRDFGRTRTEGDVIFNNANPWNSYRGPLRRASGGGSLYDLRRVALHEFGHVLGLDHPDDAGQRVAAVMNRVVSDIDSLQADDIAGGRALYGRHTPAPTAPAAAAGTAGAALGAGERRQLARHHVFGTDAAAAARSVSHRDAQRNDRDRHSLVHR